MSEFLIVLTQYLRLMLSVDITELCLKLHPWDPRAMSLVTAVSVNTELVVYSKGVEGQFSETGSLSLQEEQWPCFLTVFTVCFKTTA